MKKYLLGVILLALIVSFGALTLLGKRTLPNAPISHAWLLPFNIYACEGAVNKMIKEGTTEREIILKLGKPSDIATSPKTGRKLYSYFFGPEIPGQEVNIIIMLNEEGLVTKVETYPIAY